MHDPLTLEDLSTMRQAGKVASKAFKNIKKIMKAGSSTKDVEVLFDNFLKKYSGMEAAFKGYSGYPASLCVSINEEIIHGIPTDHKIIRDGDVVSVDLGIKYKGLFVDTAYTYLIGRVSSAAKKIVKVTYKSLQEAIKKVKIGAKIGDIGCAVQDFVEKNGFSVIRRFVGHGIGRDLHLPPEVPNFGKCKEGEELKEGYAIAIEPMVSSGTYDIDVLDDGWTVKTKDNSLSAHFEHTVVVTKKGPWVITG